MCDRAFEGVRQDLYHCPMGTQHGCCYCSLTRRERSIHRRYNIILSYGHRHRHRHRHQNSILTFFLFLGSFFLDFNACFCCCSFKRQSNYVIFTIFINLTGMVLDSAFADLTMLAEEMVRIEINFNWSKVKFQIRIWIKIVVKVDSFSMWAKCHEVSLRKKWREKKRERQWRERERNDKKEEKRGEKWREEGRKDDRWISFWEKK